MLRYSSVGDGGGGKVLGQVCATSVSKLGPHYLRKSPFEGFLENGLLWMFTRDCKNMALKGGHKKKY